MSRSSIPLDFAKLYRAAEVLARHGETSDARALLQRMWEAPGRPTAQECAIFSAMVELWASEDVDGAVALLGRLVSGTGELASFWDRRTAHEKAVFYSWHGQLAWLKQDLSAAFDSLTRAASLGLDCAVTWHALASIYVDNEELHLGVRYMRRSLQLHKQLDLLAGEGHALGAFSGRHPMGYSHGVEHYLKLLLKVAKAAHGQRNLRALRELVMEMIHLYPGDERLMKIRVLVEGAAVRDSVRL